MKVTEVRIELARPGDRLRAYATVTLENSFVVHNVRVVDLRDGSGRVAVFMPSKERTYKCRCGFQSPVLSGEHCARCGLRMPDRQARIDEVKAHVEGVLRRKGMATDKISIYLDVCNPITAEMRDEIERAVLGAYRDATNRPADCGPARDDP